MRFESRSFDDDGFRGLLMIDGKMIEVLLRSVILVWDILVRARGAPSRCVPCMAATELHFWPKKETVLRHR